MDKKLFLAQLFVEALSDFDSETIEDAIWMMNGGIGDVEERWETFYNSFEEAFGISYEDAKQLNLF